MDANCDSLVYAYGHTTVDSTPGLCALHRARQHGDADIHPNFDCHAYADADIHPNFNRHTHADADIDSDLDCHAHADAGIHFDLNCHTHVTPTAAPRPWIRSGIDGKIVISLANDPIFRQVVYAGTTEDGVFKRSACTGAWQPMGLATSSSVYVAVAPDGVIYAGSWGDGMVKSTNGGVTWTAINTGLGSPSYVFTVAVDPIDSHVVYAGTWDHGVFKTSNGGVSWQAINNGLTSQDIRTVTVDPANRQTVYAGTGDRGIFRSFNGGAAWQPLSTGLGNPVVWTIAVDPYDWLLLYAGTTGGVFRSVNYGALWLPTSITAKTKALVVDLSDPRRIYAGTTGEGVYRSHDGAQSWTAINLGLGDLNVNALALDTPVCGQLYAGTQNGVWQQSVR